MADDIRLVLSVDDRDLLRARKEQEKYQYRIAQIEKEFRKGNITAARYNRELSNQARELAKLGGGYNKANSEIRKYAYSLRSATDDQLNLAQAMAKSGKGMRRMEILAQQAGYQIGDFAVQVQSGTNVAVAFGQQASQMLGFFGPMGAVAGAGIAIATGLIAPLLNAKEAAKEATEAVDELQEKITSFTQDRLSLTTAFDPTLAKAAQKPSETLSEIIKKQLEVENLEEKYGRAKIKTITSLKKEIRELEDRYKIESDTYNQLANRLRRQEEAYNEAKAQKEWEEGSEERLLSLAESRWAEGKKRLAALEKEAQARQKIEGFARDELKKLQDQNALLQMRKQFGDQSLAVKELEKDISVENYEEELRRKGVAEDTVKQLAEQYKLSLDLKQQLQEMSQITFNFAPTSSVASTMQKYAGRGTVSAKGPIFGDGTSIYKGKTKTTGGGRSTKEILADLQKQINLEKYLVDASDARKRVVQAVGETYARNNPQIIEGLTEQVQAIKDIEAQEAKRIKTLEEAAQKQKEMQDFISQSFESGFMSIIDGTQSVKDAFRSMARDIIAELYRVLVVKKLVSAATGFFGFADGGVFQGGSQVQAFANGGVVGGPTFFPMSGGKTGLMGEAGPEAIMPLKRGKNGKLGVEASGESGNVTVVQNFSFSANGDDSVKKIIAQEAPKIAQMTQQQILESRKRGGSFRKAFG